MNHVDESARREFEAAWREPTPPSISHFLPHRTAPSYLATLEEFVCIDLEMRWAEPHNSTDKRHLPRLEDYVRCYPELVQTGLLGRLIEHEVWCRRWNSDAPSESEYKLRFPQIAVASGTFDNVLAATSETLPALPVERDAGEFGSLGHYKLIELIGRGGMACVYRAVDRQTGSLVALKVTNTAGLRTDVQHELTQRFAIEVRAASRLRHDNLMPIYESGQVSGCMFFAMPLACVDLANETGTAPLGNEVAALYMLQAARGVEALHASGILHRDVKPQNLLLQRERNQIRVADFGLARLTGHDDITHCDDVVGALPYMSPEQTHHAWSIDERADVYSLGATLYHLLVGTPPFTGCSVAEMLDRINEETAANPCDIDATVDDDLSALCMRCLEKAPSQRPSTAKQFGNDLENYLRGELVSGNC